MGSLGGQGACPLPGGVTGVLACLGRLRDCGVVSRSCGVAGVAVVLEASSWALRVQVDGYPPGPWNRPCCQGGVASGTAMWAPGAHTGGCCARGLPSDRLPGMGHGRPSGRRTSSPSVMWLFIVGGLVVLPLLPAVSELRVRRQASARAGPGWLSLSRRWGGGPAQGPCEWPSEMACVWPARLPSQAPSCPAAQLARPHSSGPS